MGVTVVLATAMVAVVAAFRQQFRGDLIGRTHPTRRRDFVEPLEHVPVQTRLVVVDPNASGYVHRRGEDLPSSIPASSTTAWSSSIIRISSCRFGVLKVRWRVAVFIAPFSSFAAAADVEADFFGELLAFCAVAPRLAALNVTIAQPQPRIQRT